MLTWLYACLQRGEALPPDDVSCSVERIRDPSRVARIMRMLAQNESPVVTRGASRPTPNAEVVRTGRMNRDGALLVEWNRRAPPAPLVVEACGYTSMYSFPWPDSPEFSGLPTELFRRQRRRHRRVRVPPRARVRFRHPLWPEVAVDRPVRDVSMQGLSFACDAVADLLFPDLDLELDVTWKGGDPIRLVGRVAHVSVARCGDTSHVCGVHLDAVGLGHSPQWSAAVEELLHPRTTRRVRGKDLWQLYAASGYFGLSDKVPEDFVELAPEFEVCRERLEMTPSVGAHFGWSSPRRLEAAMSQLEVWDRSWLLFQVARFGEARPLMAAGDDPLRELYVHAYEHALQHGARWLVTYVQSVARFSRRIQHDFAQRVASVDAEQGSVTAFRALEVPCTMVDHVRRGDPEVDKPTPAERHALLAAAASRRPAPYVAATGLKPGGLDLEGPVERYQDAGLIRRREIFVARYDGRPVAAMVLDATSTGLHCFRLVDIARVLPLAPDWKRAVAALLGRAARWYAKLGKTHFVYFAEDELDAWPQIAGARDLGLADCVVVSAARLPDLLEHIFEHTAPSED